MSIKYPELNYFPTPLSTLKLSTFYCESELTGLLTSALSYFLLTYFINVVGRIIFEKLKSYHVFSQNSASFPHLTHSESQSPSNDLECLSWLVPFLTNLTLSFSILYFSHPASIILASLTFKESGYVCLRVFVLMGSLSLTSASRNPLLASGFCSNFTFPMTPTLTSKVA